MEEYVGAIHIHSNYSDGTKSIPDIAQIAQSVDLDFLLFADHMTLKPLEDGHEGWHDKVLVLIGYEIQDPDNRNHYLAFDVDQVVSRDLAAPEYVSQIRKSGGLGFIAHPDEVRHAFDKYPPYPWTHWEIDGFDGIEIWNHMSEWMEGLTKKNRIKMILSPRKLLKGPTKFTLQKWDQLNSQRRVVGIGAIDVHAYAYRLWPFTLTIFPYKVQFQSIRTHLLMDRLLSQDLEDDKRTVYNALRSGNLFVGAITIGGLIWVSPSRVFRALIYWLACRWIARYTWSKTASESIKLSAESCFTAPTCLEPIVWRLFGVRGHGFTPITYG